MNDFFEQQLHLDDSKIDCNAFFIAKHHYLISDHLYSFHVLLVRWINKSESIIANMSSAFEIQNSIDKFHVFNRAELSNHVSNHINYLFSFIFALWRRWSWFQTVSLNVLCFMTFITFYSDMMTLFLLVIVKTDFAIWFSTWVIVLSETESIKTFLIFSIFSISISIFFSFTVHSSYNDCELHLIFLLLQALK